jgi:hypothetical protein
MDVGAMLHPIAIQSCCKRNSPFSTAQQPKHPTEQGVRQVADDERPALVCATHDAGGITSQFYKMIIFTQCTEMPARLTAATAPSAADVSRLGLV